MLHGIIQATRQVDDRFHLAKSVTRCQRLADRDLSIYVEQSKNIVNDLCGDIHFWRVDVWRNFWPIGARPRRAARCRSIGSIRASLSRLGPALTSSSGIPPTTITPSPAGGGRATIGARADEVLFAELWLDFIQAGGPGTAPATTTARATTTTTPR